MKKNKQPCLVGECRREYTHIVAEFPWLVCQKHKSGMTVMCPRYKTKTEKELADALANQ